MSAWHEQPRRRMDESGPLTRITFDIDNISQEEKHIGGYSYYYTEDDDNSPIICRYLLSGQKRVIERVPFIYD